MARRKSDEAFRFIVGVERLIATHVTSTRDASVEALVHFVAGNPYRRVIVRDVEDLVAEAVGAEAALDHMAEVAGIDVGEDVASPQTGIGDDRGELGLVLVRLDHVVDA